MAAVDFERAWFALKAHIAGKRSHGADELRVAMSDIEVECLVPESEQGYDLTPISPPRQRGNAAGRTPPGRTTSDGGAKKPATPAAA